MEYYLKTVGNFTYPSTPVSALHDRRWHWFIWQCPFFCFVSVIFSCCIPSKNQFTQWNCDSLLGKKWSFMVFLTVEFSHPMKLYLMYVLYNFADQNIFFSDAQIVFKICITLVTGYFCISFRDSEITVNSEFTIPLKDYLIIN